jgi:thermitase
MCFAVPSPGRSFLRALCLVALIGLALPTGVAARADATLKPGELLLRIQPGIDPSALAAAYVLQLADQLPGTRVLRLRTRVGVDPGALSALLRQDPRVVWAEPNFILETPEEYEQRWISIFDGGILPAAYTTQSALAQVGFGVSAQLASGAGVTVAILDTGISARPPSLFGKVRAGWNTLDNNAQTDDVPNALDDNGNGVVDEGTGHGTMVAGVVALLAPKALLLPVKVLNSDGEGDLWSVVKGIRWALDQGAKLLNLSLGLPRYSSLLAEAVDDARARGAVVITSAGNDSTAQPQYPAGLSNALTVAALAPDNTKASFSNFGGMVDLCAPGINICSTNWDGRFGVGTGTSFAAPFVTAEAALIWSLSPSLGSQAVQDIMGSTASSVDPVNPTYRNRLGKGLIAIDRALLSLTKP